MPQAQRPNARAGMTRKHLRIARAHADVILHLVDHRCDLRRLQQAAYALLAVVGHADSARLSAEVGMLERRPLLLHVRAVGWDAALQRNRSMISRSEPKQWLRLPYVSIHFSFGADQEIYKAAQHTRVWGRLSGGGTVCWQQRAVMHGPHQQRREVNQQQVDIRCFQQGQVGCDFVGAILLAGRGQTLHTRPPAHVDSSQTNTITCIMKIPRYIIYTGAGGDNGIAKCRTVGKSQPVLMMIDPIISTRTRITNRSHRHHGSACSCKHRPV
jgi:hypothetical protein